MTAEQFRRAALALPGAIESTHMNHPDFRLANRIFATLGSPDAGWGMVKLPPEEAAKLIDALPEAFAPAAGAWGRQGSTLVRLADARVPTVKHALEMAWQLAETAAKTSRPRVRPRVSAPPAPATRDTAKR